VVVGGHARDARRSPYRFGQYRNFALARTRLAVATRDGAAATVYVYAKR
jgi:hypothetical protein